MQLSQSPAIQIRSSALRMQLAASGAGYYIGMPMRAEELESCGLVCRVIPETWLYIGAILTQVNAQEAALDEMLALVCDEYSGDGYFQPHRL